MNADAKRVTGPFDMPASAIGFLQRPPMPAMPSVGRRSSSAIQARPGAFVYAVGRQESTAGPLALRGSQTAAMSRSFPTTIPPNERAFGHAGDAILANWRFHPGQPSWLKRPAKDPAVRRVPLLVRPRRLRGR